MTKTLQSVLVSLVVTFLGVVIVGYLAATQWMGPWTPVRIILLGVLAPVVLFGVLITMPADGEKWTPGRILAGAIPGVTLGFVGMLIAFTWSREGVRKMAVDRMDDDVSNLTKALGDRSPQVAAHACKRMISVGPGEFRDLLLRTLQSRPDVAGKCLSENDGRRVRTYAKVVLERWETAVLGGARIDNNACKLPDHIATMEIERAMADRILLSCVLRTQNPEVGVCCANNLATSLGTGAEFLAALQERAGLLSESGLAADIVSSAFKTQKVSEDLAREIKRLGLDSESGRKVTLSIACDAIGTVDNPAAITQHLAASLDDVCKVDTFAIPRGRKTWLDFCDQTEALLDKYEDLAATESLCVGVRAMALDRAVEQAGDMVMTALESRQLGSLTDDIDSGWAMRGDPRENARAARFDQMIDSMESDPNLPPQGRALIESMREHGVNAGMEDSLDQITGKASGAADQLGVSQEQIEALQELSTMPAVR